MFHSKRDLGGRDCLFVAQHAFADGYYDTALQWAEAAVERFIRKGGSSNSESELDNFRREVKKFVDHATRVVCRLPFISKHISRADLQLPVILKYGEIVDDVRSSHFRASEYHISRPPALQIMYLLYQRIARM